MAIQTLILVTLLLLAVDAHADYSKFDPYSSPKSLGLSGRDVTTLAIGEVHSVREFIHFVSWLKSERMGAPLGFDLHECEMGLSNGLSDLRRTLESLKVRGPGNKHAPGANSLRDMIGQIIDFNNFCHSALSDADGLIMQMLDKKLEDVALLLDNVASRYLSFN